MKDELTLDLGVVTEMFEEGTPHLDVDEGVTELEEASLTFAFTKLARQLLAPMFIQVKASENILLSFGLDLAAISSLRAETYEVILELELLSSKVCTRPEFRGFAQVIERSLIERTLLSAWKMVEMSVGIPREKHIKAFGEVSETLKLLEGGAAETKARCFVYAIVGTLQEILILEGESINPAPPVQKELLTLIQNHTRKVAKKKKKRKL